MKGKFTVTVEDTKTYILEVWATDQENIEEQINKMMEESKVRDYEVFDREWDITKVEYAGDSRKDNDYDPE